MRALLGFLATLPENVKKIQLHLPIDMDLWDELAKPPTTRLHADQQLRIIDLAAAIRGRGYRSDACGRTSASLILRIIDRHARWNHGTWSIRWSGDKVASMRRVGRTDAARPMMTADIAEFAQIYCGYKSARDLAAAEKIQVHSPRPAALFDLLDRLFHDRPTHTQDWF